MATRQHFMQGGIWRGTAGIDPVIDGANFDDIIAHTGEGSQMKGLGVRLPCTVVMRQSEDRRDEVRTIGPQRDMPITGPRSRGVVTRELPDRQTPLMLMV